MIALRFRWQIVALEMLNHELDGSIRLLDAQMRHQRSQDPRHLPTDVRNRPHALFWTRTQRKKNGAHSQEKGPGPTTMATTPLSITGRARHCPGQGRPNQKKKGGKARLPNLRRLQVHIDHLRAHIYATDTLQGRFGNSSLRSDDSRLRGTSDYGWRGWCCRPRRKHEVEMRLTAVVLVLGALSAAVVRCDARGVPRAHCEENSTECLSWWRWDTPDGCRERGCCHFSPSWSPA